MTWRGGGKSAGRSADSGFPSHQPCREVSLASTAQPYPSDRKEQKTREDSLREGSNYAGSRVLSRLREANFRTDSGHLSQERNGIPTYLAAPLGGDALLGAGGRESLGRDVQHPGPPARAVSGLSHRTDSPGGTPAPTTACLVRLHGRAEARAPDPLPGLPGDLHSMTQARSRKAGRGRSQKEGAPVGRGQKKKNNAGEAHAQLVSGPKLQHHKEMTAFC